MTVYVHGQDKISRWAVWWERRAQKCCCAYHFTATSERIRFPNYCTAPDREATSFLICSFNQKSTANSLSTLASCLAKNTTESQTQKPLHFHFILNFIHHFIQKSAAKPLSTLTAQREPVIEKLSVRTVQTWHIAMEFALNVSPCKACGHF